MKPMPRLVLLLAGAALLGGASRPFAPKDARFGPDYAEVVFELGVTDTVSMGSATTQEYRISETEDWDAGRFVKLFTWAAKKPKTLLLPVGKPIYVFGQMDRMFGAPGLTSSGNNKCLNGSYFTPQPNVRYRVKQTGSPFGPCTMAVIDAATGAAPEDLRIVLFPPSLADPGRR